MAANDGRDPGFEQFERFLDAWSRRDFIRRMGGAAALAAFSIGGLEFLEACGGNQAAQTQNVKKGGHVTEGSLSDPTTFNIIFSSDTSSSSLLGMMFAGLLDFRADGTQIPMIAKEVPKVEPDQLTYKFNLRQDVKWSDGQPVTSDDVLFTYSLMAGSTYDYKAINSRYWPDLEQYLDSVKAPDKYTVIMKTKVPYAPFLTNYVFAPLPKHVLEPVVQKSAADFRKADFNFAPTVVSGPFMFDRWDKSQQVLLKANPGHFRGRPNLDSYVMKTVPDGVAIANQLKTGEIDVGNGVEPSLWDDMATASNVSRTSFAQSGVGLLRIQHGPDQPQAASDGQDLRRPRDRQDGAPGPVLRGRPPEPGRQGLFQAGGRRDHGRATDILGAQHQRPEVPLRPQEGRGHARPGRLEAWLRRRPGQGRRALELRGHHQRRQQGPRDHHPGPGGVLEEDRRRGPAQTDPVHGVREDLDHP